MEVETYKHNGRTIRIEYDQDAECPLEWDAGSGTQFVTFERNSTLSRYHSFESPQNMDFGVPGTVFNLYKYDHGQVHYSITPFSCPWDSGQVGVVFVPASFVEHKKTAEALCEDVTAWCNGEVYGYTIDNEDESCWGFYDIDDCKAEANAAVDWIVERKAKQSAAYGFGYLAAAHS